MKISLIHPSRGRALKSFENSSEWLKKAGDVEVELIVAVDLSDPHLNGYEMAYQTLHKRAIGSLGFNCKMQSNSIDIYENEWFKLVCSNNNSVVSATNTAAKLAKGDILIYLSDDFKCPDNWGELVVKEFENENRPLLVKVDDMLQPFQVPVLTIPMMNRALYEILGYFFHPWYKSMHVDVDLYHTVMGIGALKNASHLKFEHCHVSVGKAQDDETYRASSANWNQGLEVYNRRKKMKFSV